MASGITSGRPSLSEESEGVERVEQVRHVSPGSEQVDERRDAERGRQPGERRHHGPVAGHQEAGPVAQQGRDGTQQQPLVLLRREPPHRADHPGLQGDAELRPDAFAGGLVRGKSLQLDAVADDREPALVDLPAGAGERRGLGRDGDEGVHAERGQPGHDQLLGAARVPAVLGVHDREARQPAGRSAGHEGHPVVGVDEIHPVGTEPAGKAEHQRRVGTLPSALHPGDRRSGGQELGGQTAIRGRGQRDGRHPVPGPDLARGQVERHALLAPELERGQDVGDVDPFSHGNLMAAPVLG